MSSDSLAKSIVSKLKNLEKTTGHSFANLRLQLILERLIGRIETNPKIEDSLIFKGGYVSFRVYDSPRYTKDIDALSLEPIEKVQEEIIKSVIKPLQNDPVWFVFETVEDLKTQGSYGGVRLNFRTGIGSKPKDLSKHQVISMDLSYGDSVHPAAKEPHVKKLLEDEPISWKVYPIESIISEKIHALISKGSMNSRSKDIFDIHFLIEKCDPLDLKEAIKKTFTSLGEKPPVNILKTILDLDTTRLSLGWKSATSQVGELDFKKVFDEMIEKLRFSLK